MIGTSRACMPGVTATRTPIAKRPDGPPPMAIPDHTSAVGPFRWRIAYIVDGEELVKEVTTLNGRGLSAVRAAALPRGASVQRVSPL